MKLLIFYRAQRCIALVTSTVPHLVLFWTRWCKVHNLKIYLLSITLTNIITLMSMSIVPRKYLSLDSVTDIMFAFVILNFFETFSSIVLEHLVKDRLTNYAAPCYAFLFNLLLLTFCFKTPQCVFSYGQKTGPHSLKENKKIKNAWNHICNILKYLHVLCVR